MITSNTAHKSSPLDLHDRAMLGLRFLVNSVDERNGCLPNLWAHFGLGPAVARHEFADFGDLTSRYLEGIYLAKCMTGSNLGDDVLVSLENLFMSYFMYGDGLSYRPPIDSAFISKITKQPYKADIAEGFDQSRVMHALITWFSATQDEKPKHLFESLIEGLRDKTVIQDDCMYFEDPAFLPGYKPSLCRPAHPQQLYFGGTQILPLTRWYELTGNDLALYTARKLANFITKDTFYFGENGSFESLRVVTRESWDVINGHTHSRLSTIAGLLKYGRVASDERVFQIGKKAFDWFYTRHCISTGWCPEFLGNGDIEEAGCETCTLMDVIHCCLELSARGHDEYWSIIERIARNQLVEQQLTDTSFVEYSENTSDNTFECYRMACDSLLGGFGGWCGPNDFVGRNKSSQWLMNCCGPSGVKALYLVWHNAVQWSDGDLHINLLISRRSEYADVISCDPVRGRIDILPKQDCRLTVHLPDWVDKRSVKLLIEDKSREVEWQGSRILAGMVRDHQNVVIEYDLRETTITDAVGDLEYQSRWIGDTAVSMSPGGANVPLYLREWLIDPNTLPVLPDYTPDREFDA